MEHQSSLEAVEIKVSKIERNFKSHDFSLSLFDNPYVQIPRPPALLVQWLFLRL